MANSLPDASVFELSLPRRRSVGFILGGLGLVVAIAVADYVTGYELRLAILYLVPIAVVTWQQGRLAGTLVSTVAATAWLISFQTSHYYSRTFYLYWEAGLAIATYVIYLLLIARLRDALARSDERFVTVLEGLDAAVFAEEARTGKILYANRRFRDAHGGQRPWSAAPGDLSGEVVDEQSGRSYLVQGRALRWVDGREVTLYVLADITEEKRSRETMARHRDAIHRQSRLISLGEFASTVAHELTQPLAAISTYNSAALRLLDSGGRVDPAELGEAMRKSGDQARRAGAIIQRLRELLRQPGPELAAHDLNRIAAAALRLAEPEARETGAEIVLLEAPAPVPVLVDALLIEQVVLNLLRNAIEATRNLDARRRKALVALSPSSNGGVSLAVTDWGEGVAPSIAPRLFEPFVTARPGGLGLGLSICRSVVEAHGGTIHHRPNAEGGSVFEFVLPRRQA